MYIAVREQRGEKVVIMVQQSSVEPVVMAVTSRCTGLTVAGKGSISESMEPN